jgi:serine protease
VDFSHSEFAAGQLIAGRDWIDGDNNPTDNDVANTEGHGTHTTGTMAGRTVGVAGATGAGANVRVYVQRVCNGNGCPTSAIVNAIRAAADYPGMVAMNLSLGGGTESRSEKDAIAYATSKNVLVIASAGNDGSGRVSCPACDSNAISVAALNWQDALSYYSNYGSGLDLSAPGGEMYSNTTEEGGIYSSVPGGYAYLQGTSMAAPQVTGTAAVVASKTGLRGAALRSRLQSTADDLGAGGYDSRFGYGRVNTYRAVTGTSSGGGGTGGGTCHGRKCQ